MGLWAGLAAGGGLAVAAQWLAHRGVAGWDGHSNADFWRRHFRGTGLRVGAGLLAALLAMVDRDLFPPLPTVLGYCGMLLGLLALELRTGR